MGELKKIADKNRQIKELENALKDNNEKFVKANQTHLSTVARATREAEEKLRQFNSMSSSTTTNSDNNIETEKSEYEKELEKLDKLEYLKKEKVKHKTEKEIQDKEDGYAKQDVDNDKIQRRREEIEANKKETEISKSEAEKDKFSKKDTNLKEKSQITDSEQKLDKINNSTDKINNQHSLDKMRGIKETENARKAANATDKAAKTKAASEAAKQATTKATATATAKGAEAGAAGGAAAATESTPIGWIVLIIVAIIFLFFIIFIVMMFLLSALPAMIGGGGSSSSNSSATQDEIILYNTLMEHFEDNETAVLGIMCNVYYESSFHANNLEDFNNGVWGISDEEYTDAVNDGTLTREQFSKDMWGGSCLGIPKPGGWYNPNGGYGLCQFTSYDKKDGLYQYALDYYDFGIGEYQDFNIGDATMQANYICYLLDGEYSDLDTQLREATTVEDATYVWTSGYEKPAGDDRTIANLRAEMADTILAECQAGVGGGGGSITEEELSATHIHYNQYDERWGSLPYYYKDGGSNTIEDSGCGPTCFAMVVTELTRDTSNPVVLTPDEACNFSANHGLHTNEGTAHQLFYNNSMIETYGINGAVVGQDEAKMKEELDSGHLLVITVNAPSVYTGNGHFMIICEYDETGFLINDPNYSDSKPYRVSMSYLQSQGLTSVYTLWSIY